MPRPGRLRSYDGWPADTAAESGSCRAVDATAPRPWSCPCPRLRGRAWLSHPSPADDNLPKSATLLASGISLMDVMSVFAGLFKHDSSGAED